jgi:hypothetical protein
MSTRSVPEGRSSPVDHRGSGRFTSGRFQARGSDDPLSANSGSDRTSKHEDDHAGDLDSDLSRLSQKAGTNTREICTIANIFDGIPLTTNVPLAKRLSTALTGANANHCHKCVAGSSVVTFPGLSYEPTPHCDCELRSWVVLWSQTHSGLHTRPVDASMVYGPRIYHEKAASMRSYAHRHVHVLSLNPLRTKTGGSIITISGVDSYALRAYSKIWSAVCAHLHLDASLPIIKAFVRGTKVHAKGERPFIHETITYLLSEIDEMGTYQTEIGLARSLYMMVTNGPLGNPGSVCKYLAFRTLDTRCVCEGIGVEFDD